MAPPASQDEARSRYSVSGEVPRWELEVETVLGTLNAPQKVPRHPGLPGEEHRGFPAPLPLSPTTLLISTGGSTPLLCLEGVPDLPVAPQDEAGLTKTFQTWPRGWFHIP